MASVWGELKRRNVVRVAVAYAIAAWLLIEITATTFPILKLPDWSVTLVTVLVLIGFPLALILAWAFELTPEGIKKEKDVDRSESITHITGRKLDYLIIGVLMVALGFFAYDKFVLVPGRDAVEIEAAVQVAQEQVAGPVEPQDSIKSIAVLPFVNMSDDPGNEYFSDGISEELLNLLAQIPELRVISRSSAFSFKGKDIAIPTVAEQLNIAYVLEGSVRKVGNRVRITAQLIEARSDTHLWSESYDRTLDDVFAIQDEIAANVVEQLKITLLNPVPTSKEVNPEAHRLYLLGQYHLYKWKPADLEKAVRYFQQAIELDPQYAQPHVALAIYYGAIGFWGYMPPRFAFEKERAAAARALDIDSNLASAHAEHAQVYFLFDWDWEKAEEKFQRALSLNSNYADAHQFYAWFLVTMGRTEEAHTSIRRALELDPLAIFAYNTAADVFYMSRQYDQAITQLHVALDLSPNDPYVLCRIGWSHLQKGMFTEAIGEMEQAVTLSPDIIEHHWMLGHAYAVAGKTAEARKILDDLHALAEKQYILPFAFAVMHTGLGENDEALAWLERAYQDRNAWMVYLQVAPWLDPLRSDPRFQDLLRRMNFPE